VEESVSCGAALIGIGSLDSMCQLDDRHYGKGGFCVPQGFGNLLNHTARILARSLGRNQRRRIQNDSHAT